MRRALIGMRRARVALCLMMHEGAARALGDELREKGHLPCWERLVQGTKRRGSLPAILLAAFASLPCSHRSTTLLQP